MAHDVHDVFAACFSNPRSEHGHHPRRTGPSPQSRPAGATARLRARAAASAGVQRLGVAREQARAAAAPGHDSHPKVSKSQEPALQR